MPAGIITIVSIVGAVLLGLGIVSLILARLYRRSSKEMAFVRTGLGGEKVVINGGALILPIFHEVIDISMKTTRLTVSRRETESLITKDSMRVDVTADFFIRVKPDAESISTAAQTLGSSTLEPQLLKNLIEAKFVDALRSVAASMDMQDLHQRRNDFVAQVQQTVAEDLTKNGLELETVSLSALDQTEEKFMNENNAFDAVGLTKLKGITETRRRERNDIEAETRVAIEQKNLEANKQSLTIAQQDEEARLEQERVLETRRAEQAANLATERAQRNKESEMAELEAKTTVEQERVARKQVIDAAQVTADKQLEIAKQNRNIEIAEKSRAESVAQAEADRAKAEAVKAAEEVKTAEELAKAERLKSISIIKATEIAEQEAVKIRVQAAAEREAADNQAAARNVLLDVEAREYEVRADGERKLVEAVNVKSDRIIEAELREKLIAQLPEIIEAQYRPMEKVGDIRMLVTGAGGLVGSAGGAAGGGDAANVPAALANAAMQYRLQAPMIDAFTETMGIDLTKGIDGLMTAAIPTVTPKAPEVPAPRPAPRPPVSDAEELAHLQKLSGIEKKS